MTADTAGIQTSNFSMMRRTHERTIIWQASVIHPAKASSKRHANGPGIGKPRDSEFRIVQ
jgi:hypothetical protein